MKKILAGLVIAAALVQVYAATYHSSSLGWTAGANVDTKLASFLSGTAAAGDTLQLDALYKVTTYNNSFPDNFTLTAVKGGGFDCAGSSASATAGGYYFVAGKNMLLDNCTFISSTAPETDFQGNNPVQGTDFHKGSMWSAKVGNTIIQWCSFAGNLEAHLCPAGKFTIKNSSFYRGKEQIYITGVCPDVYLYQSLWNDALVDGIKTVETSSGSNTGWLIDDCIFQNSRDGIDVTGGLQDTEIRNSIFRMLNVTAFDAKILLENLDDYTSDHAVTKNVTFNDCEFIDIRNCIVSTFLNKQNETITYAVQELLVPQYITTNRCIYECTPQRTDEMDMYLIKMGHHIIWNDAVRAGNVDSTFRTLNDNVQDGWLSHDNYGTMTTAAARDRNYDIHFSYGPQDASGITDLPRITSRLYENGTGTIRSLTGRDVGAEGNIPAGIYIIDRGGYLDKMIVK